jgi:hypothetical protein
MPVYIYRAKKVSTRICRGKDDFKKEVMIGDGKTDKASRALTHPHKFLHLALLHYNLKLALLGGVEAKENI